MQTERPAERLPLHALRAFEAAARHLSFTRAAVELNVSQAAVSRHVRELEKALGLPLFTRLHRSVALTAGGTRLSQQLTRNFQALARCVAELRGERLETLKISVEPAFAARWLVPRLPRFLALHPKVDVEIEASETLREIGRDSHIAVRFIDAARRAPTGHAMLLVPCPVFPVLAPSLAAGKRLDAPAALLQYPLLHEDDGRYWQAWLRAAGAPDVKPRRAIRFNDPGLALQAAIDGQGVALGDEVLAGAELRAGRLLRPFDTSLKAGSYWIVTGAKTARNSAARAFRQWLKEEIDRPV